MPYKIFFAIAFFFLVSCDASNGSNNDDTNIGEPLAIPEAAFIPYTIVNAYPHDTSAFTQGLEVYNGALIESTGLEGRSSLRQVDTRSGAVKQVRKLDNKIFGEGVTVLNDTLYQLTWQNHKVLLYQPRTLKPIGELTWSYEGWGITNDGKLLYISDGSDKIYVVRPGDLKLQRVISVTDHLGPINNLNELEFVRGSIYANRLDYNYILRIDPANGLVSGKLDLSDVLKKYSKMDLSYIKNNPHGAVLNGIAWDSTAGKMYVTGKFWPLLFELELQP